MESELDPAVELERKGDQSVFRVHSGQTQRQKTAPPADAQIAAIGLQLSR